MKKIFFMLLIMILFSLQPLISAQIPWGVSSTKVVIDGSIDISDTGQWCNINGLPAHSNENTELDGLWDFIEMDTMDYTFTFWNVGQEGEAVGMLFWKEEYKKATLTIRCIAATEGSFWRLNGYLDDDETVPIYQYEEAGSFPEFNEITYNMEFTGTPWGNFYELNPFVNTAQKKLTARLTAKGEHVVFDVPEVTQADIDANGGQYPNPPFMNKLDGVLLKVPDNPWFGWVLEDSGECSGDSGARFTDFSGEVTVYPETDEDDTRPAELDDVLEICDHITTEDDSSAIISFADMTTFHMKASSHIYIASPPRRRTHFELIAGDILTNVRKMVKDGSMDVTMNQAVAGCKGTVFICSEDGTTSSVKVLDGTVEFTSTATGDVELINAGESISATSSGLSEKTSFDVDEELKNWPDYEFIPGDFEYIEWDPTESTEEDSQPVTNTNSNTPGFELILIIITAIFVILIRRKKQ